MEYVCVTGGCGFIGSHLVERLVADGERVVVIDDLSTGNIRNLAVVWNKIKFFHGAVYHGADCWQRFWQEDVCGYKPKVIYHLAATVGVQTIMENRARGIDNNLEMTDTVLAFALPLQAHIVFSSSSECYGKSTKVPFVEDESDTVLGPSCIHRWSYAAAKLVDEFKLLAYHHDYGLPVTILRLFNVVGPRQCGHEGMVLPRLAGQALAGEPLTVYGDGAQTRTFCHVADVVDALVAAGKGGAVGQVVNVGSTEEIPIGKLALLVDKAVGGAPRPVVHVPFVEVYGPACEDMQRRVPSIEKAKRLLGWEPKRTLGQAIHDVVEHLRANPALTVI